MTGSQVGPASGATFWTGWKIEGMTTKGQFVGPIPFTGNRVSGGVSFQTITLKQTASGKTADYSGRFGVASVSAQSIPGSNAASKLGTKIIEAVGKVFKGWGFGWSPSSWSTLGSEILGTPNLPASPKAEHFDCFMTIWEPNIALPVLGRPLSVTGAAGLVFWTGLPFVPTPLYGPIWAHSIKGVALFASPGLALLPGGAIDVLHGVLSLEKP